ncbi:MAG: hypothetical protein GC204_08815 [Chloroflexi bacterium]|nr:hypothetical protein [Chloroflexota bacterium]
MQPYIHLFPLPGIDYDLTTFLKPSSMKRDFFTSNFYHCLPMTAANTLGWTLYNPYKFKVLWKGGTEREALQVEVYDGPPNWVRSWFGHGVFTIMPGFLFETSPGVDLLLRPVPNHFKLPVLTLDGIVETDWLKASVTFNFRLMLPMIGAVYEVGEPLLQLVPYPRDFVETFDTRVVTSGAAYEQRVQAYVEWGEKRDQLQEDERHHKADHHYTRGIDIDQTVMREHKKTFRLREFTPLDDDAE